MTVGLVLQEESNGIGCVGIFRGRSQLDVLQKSKEDRTLMRVKPRQKRQIITAGGSFVGFALSQNAVGIRLQHGPDRIETLLCRPFAPVRQRNAVQGSYKRIRPLHIVSLILEQRVLSTVVKLLDQADEHIRHIVERTGGLNHLQRRRERQPLRIGTIMDGTQIQRPRFGGKLFNFHVRNIGEETRREGLLPKPFQMIEKIAGVLGGRLLRLVLQPVPRTLGPFRWPLE